MKVLVIQPKIGMGDMVIYLPYIHAISKYYRSSISILAKNNSRAKELLIDDDSISEILILDRLSDKSGSHDGVRGFLKLAKEIKSKHYDKVFIFSSSLRYFLFASSQLFIFSHESQIESLFVESVCWWLNIAQSMAQKRQLI